MPITIDGDGTITGVSVGGLPDGIVDADMIASNAVTTAKISDSQITEAKLASDPQKGLAKAWVDFDGSVSDPSSTVEGYNVGSITDNGTGDYTLNFTNSLSNANYVVVGMAHDDAIGNNDYLYGLKSNNQAWRGGTHLTTSSARVVCGYAGNDSVADMKRVSIVVFGA